MTTHSFQGNLNGTPGSLKPLTFDPSCHPEEPSPAGTLSGACTSAGKNTVNMTVLLCSVAQATVSLGPH